MRWIVPFAALALAGCPIAPDNYNDAGPDAGPSIGDAGGDAGTPASGTVSCQIGAANGATSDQIVGAWSGADLGGTASSFDGTSYTVLISGDNAASGVLSIQLSGLVAGSTTGNVDGISWQAPAGFPIPDTWSCSAGGACSGAVNLQSFDGVNLIGSFSTQFYATASTSGGDTASLSGGAFSISLPH